MLEWLAEYEAELEAAAKSEMSKEDAAFAALPQEEKDRINAERAAYYESLCADGEIPESDDTEDEEDED